MNRKQLKQEAAKSGLKLTHEVDCMHNEGIIISVLNHLDDSIKAWTNRKGIPEGIKEEFIVALMEDERRWEKIHDEYIKKYEKFRKPAEIIDFPGCKNGRKVS